MVDELKRKPARWRVVVMLAAAAALLVTREQLMFAADLWLACHSDYPTAGNLKSLFVREPERVIRALWLTQKIPHRTAAIEYVKSRAMMEPGFVRGFDGLLREALTDPDQSVRKMALTTLASVNHPLTADAARWFLTQGDPGLIMEGLLRLRQARMTNHVADIAALLDYPLQATAVMAGQSLKSLTGADFDLEGGLGRRTAGMSEGEWADRVAATERALDRVRDWWRVNVTNWPARSPLVRWKSDSRLLRPLEFADAGMKPLSTARLRGRPVLLFFYVTFCGTCQMMLPELPALRSELAGKVELVAVSLDAVPDDHNHFIELNMEEDRDDHGHHDHGHHHETHFAPAEVVAASAKVTEGQSPGLKPVFDVTGVATGILNAGEVPVMAVLDAEGRLVRRLTMRRSAAELKVLLRHLLPGKFAGSDAG